MFSLEFAAPMKKIELAMHVWLEAQQPTRRKKWKGTSESVHSCTARVAECVVEVGREKIG